MSERRDSKSQCDSKNTTRSKFTMRSIFSTAGSFGQCSFVYPYPSVSDRARKLRPWSEKNSDQNPDHPRLCIYQGKEKLRPWSEFLGRENSDHGLSLGCFCQKNLRAHKSKIGTPPPQNPKSPPPPGPKTRNFMDMEVFLQKESKNSRRP